MVVHPAIVDSHACRTRQSHRKGRSAVWNRLPGRRRDGGRLGGPAADCAHSGGRRVAAERRLGGGGARSDRFRLGFRLRLGFQRSPHLGAAPGRRGPDGTAADARTSPVHGGCPIFDSQLRSDRPADRRGPAAAGAPGDGGRFGRHAPVPGMALPPGVRRGGGGGHGTRRLHHHRPVLAARSGDLAYRGGGPAHADRLFHERHHRGVRSHPGKSPHGPARASGRNRQPQHQSDPQPHGSHFRADLAHRLSLLLFGGPVLHGFSLALAIGIVVGTFSSIFIASPILLAWEERRAAFAAPRVSLSARASAGAPMGRPTGGVR